MKQTNRLREFCVIRDFTEYKTLIYIKNKVLPEQSSLRLMFSVKAFRHKEAMGVYIAPIDLWGLIDSCHHGRSYQYALRAKINS